MWFGCVVASAVYSFVTYIEKYEYNYLLKTSKMYAMLKHLEIAKKKNVADPARSQHIYICPQLLSPSFHTGRHGPHLITKRVSSAPS